MRTTTFQIAATFSCLAVALVSFGCRATPGDAEGKDKAPASSAAPREPSPGTATSAANPCPTTGAITLEQLKGRWKVRSTSGQPDRGHAFHALIGEELTVTGDLLAIPDHAFDAQGARVTYKMTKRITLLTCTSPQAIDLNQTSDAKGWSRVGIVELQGNTLKLSVNFPQNPRPPNFEAAEDGREVVTLERLP